jgi:hypothetical protein
MSLNHHSCRISRLLLTWHHSNSCIWHTGAAAAHHSWLHCGNAAGHAF